MVGKAGMVGARIKWGASDDPSEAQCLRVKRNFGGRMGLWGWGSLTGR